MTCVNPARAWFTSTGAFFWPVSGSEEGSLPCGKCIGCRARQAMDWSTRCWCEARLYDQSSFITLTYAEEPSGESDAVDGWKNFAKALRRRIGKFRYFAVTERGALHGRLHHHALIFGHDFLEPGKEALLRAAWATQSGSGFVDVAACEDASINYVAGYTAKKLHASTTDDLRMRASLAPPIGYNWLLLHHDDIERVGGVVISGKLRPIPVMFFERDKFGLRHVKADKKSWAMAHARSELALRARRVQMEIKQREKNRSSKL